MMALYYDKTIIISVQRYSIACMHSYSSVVSSQIVVMSNIIAVSEQEQQSCTTEGDSRDVISNLSIYSYISIKSYCS